MNARVSPQHVAALAAAARLPLPAGRAEELAGAVASLIRDCARLEEVDTSDHEAPEAPAMPDRDGPR